MCKSHDLLVVSFALTLFTLSRSFTINDGPLDITKEEIFNHLSLLEKRLIFGNDENPQFQIVYPKWIDGNHLGTKTLDIKDTDIDLNIVVKPSNKFRAYDVITNSDVITDDDERGNCHWRFVNASLVVVVDECFAHGINALILSDTSSGVLYPANVEHIPKMMTNDIHPHLFYNVPRDVLNDWLQDSKDSLTNSDKLNRRKRSNGKANGFHISDPLVPFSDKVDEYADFPELVVDLESDLQRFRVTDGHFYSIDPEVIHGDESDKIEIKLRKTVEIAVFCDSALVQNFGQNLPGPSQITLSKYIDILMNALEGIYHQEELGGYIIDLKLVGVFMLGPSEGPNDFGADIGKYLQEFSDWQSNRNSGTDDDAGHWDHAIMLSGLDLHSGGNTGVIGLAWVGGMCNSRFSATLNEGRSFLSVYIVAHEMGHNLGMDHDGSQSFANCNSENHIMSPSVGPGKTTWSTCSVQVVQQFLRRPTCLDDGGSTGITSTIPPSTSQPTSQPPPDIEAIKRNLPGQVFPPEQQCQLAHGPNYKPLTRPGNDMCSYLFCSSNGITRGAHPALQGSDCAPGRICIAGSCKDEDELRRLIVLFLFVFENTKDKDLQSFRDTEHTLHGIEVTKAGSDHLSSHTNH